MVRGRRDQMHQLRQLPDHICGRRTACLGRGDTEVRLSVEGGVNRWTNFGNFPTTFVAAARRVLVGAIPKCGCRSSAIAPGSSTSRQSPGAGSVEGGVDDCSDVAELAGVAV